MKNGCFDRAPFKPRLKVQDGFWDDGVQRIPKLTQIPFRMATACQYTHTTLGRADKGCDGCKHKEIG